VRSVAGGFEFECRIFEHVVEQDDEFAHHGSESWGIESVKLTGEIPLYIGQ
jgi:hypothetical protein